MSEVITISGVPLVVKRTRRARRVRIRVDPRRGEAVLVLPPRAALREGREFALDNAAWLRARIDELPPRVAFAAGAEVPLGGVVHLLRWEPDLPARVQLDARTIRVGGDREGFARRLTDWLKRRARERVTRRAEALAADVGRKIGRVSIRDPRARWGSCSHKGALSFSWRLILAPDAVLDYVVAHEIAHLVHLHHGPTFWRTVERLMPEHAAARAWLDRHGAELQRYG